MIALEPICKDNIQSVLSLDVTPGQKPFYPRSNAYSIAEGLFPQDDDPVWMSAICNDGEPIGFMMTSEIPENGEYFLWRMMIDERSQGKGYGALAMNLLIRRIVDNGNPKVLLLSHLKGNTDAGRFYSRFGFTYTGEDSGGSDLEMVLRF